MFEGIHYTFLKLLNRFNRFVDAMNVDPMSRFGTKMTTQQTKVVTLEGKSRLPLRIQETIIDLGTIINTTQHYSATGEVNNSLFLSINLCLGIATTTFG
jgi:hypothetical protein